MQALNNEGEGGDHLWRNAHGFSKKMHFSSFIFYR